MFVPFTTETTVPVVSAMFANLLVSCAVLTAMEWDAVYSYTLPHNSLSLSPRICASTAAKLSFELLMVKQNWLSWEILHYRLSAAHRGYELASAIFKLSTICEVRQLTSKFFKHNVTSEFNFPYQRPVAMFVKFLYCSWWGNSTRRLISGQMINFLDLMVNHHCSLWSKALSL